MYLYYDRYGTLKEQITFNPARVGNSNVNKIFVYWEGVEEFPDWAQELALQTRYLLQDNTQYPSATTFEFSTQYETAELPFDKNQDLKYFKYYKEYKFLTIDIPDEVLSYNGAVKSYIWVLNADKKRILGLGVFAFMVDGDINEVIPDENISLAQWNMISAQLGLLSGSVIDVTCDIETNTLKVYYANGLTAIRNLPPNGVQTTISSDFLREMIFSADTWVQDGENGYYIYFRAETVGYTDNRFFVQLEKDGEYNSDYYNKTGSFVLSDNIFKGSDGSVLLYSNEPYSGRLLVVGGDLLSGDILVTGLSYNDVNSQLSYKTADGITHTIYLGINEKFDKSNISQTTGDSTVKVMSQKAATDNFARLVDGKVPASQLPSYVDDVVEYDSKNDFPATGEEGKIYVDKSTNLTYRWSGSTYIQVGGGDLNLENGTGTGSLVQKTVSSSGTPYNNEASGSGSVAFGKDTKSKGNSSFVTGQKNRATENASRGFVGGYDNTIDNATTFAFGQGLKNSRERKSTFGQWNKDEYDTLFEVGCGTSDEDRHNAFEVRKNGIVIMKDRAKVYGVPQDPTDVVRLEDLGKLSVSKYRHRLSISNSSMSYHFVFYTSFSTPITTTSLINSNGSYISFSYGLNVNTNKVCMCVGYAPLEALMIADNGILVRFNYSSMTNITDSVVEL